MNSVNEKEKKLKLALTRLSNFNLNNPLNTNSMDENIISKNYLKE